MQLTHSTLVGLVCVACTAGETQEKPRDGLRAELVGCYALYTPGGKLLDSTFYNASPLVRLDSSPLGITARDTVPGIFRRMVRLDRSGHPVDRMDSTSFSFRSWYADSLSDSIRASFSDGFSGAEVILAAPGRVDTLWGRIVENWDMGPTTNDRGRVYAVRVRCSGTA